MKGIYKLHNEIKHYDWGSPRFIPEFLRIKNEAGRPCAELWMGAHPSGMSFILDDDGRHPLDAFIGRDKPYFLGAPCAKQFGALPFLLKLLAAEKPLSIQAHPNLEQAKRGFERENALGIALCAPERNYKDANHKPEIICALSDFRAMCGFRDIAEIICLFEKLNAPFSRIFLGSLAAGGDRGENLYQLFLETLFSLPEPECESLFSHIQNNSEALKEKHPEFSREWELIARFNTLFPGDRTILAPLYLNVIDLKPGEAIFLPAGILHAYVCGFGVELMAASDNVLRGGLTKKWTDRRELLSILKPEPFMPQIIKAPRSDYFEYPCGADEFSLIFIKGQGGEKKKLPSGGAVILVVVEGMLEIYDKNNSRGLTLSRGESAFIASGASRDGLALSGEYSLYMSTPKNSG